MSQDQGPWGGHDPIDDADERERADQPSGAARWVVISLGMWIAVIGVVLFFYLH